MMPWLKSLPKQKFAGYISQELPRQVNQQIKMLIAGLYDSQNSRANAVDNRIISGECQSLSFDLK
jgi:hypothetical protein